MRLTALSLTNFRNIERLELRLPPGPVLLVGENAQGKTNLLEAVYLLATTRSLRAASDTELIRRDALAAPGEVGARVVGRAARGGGTVQVEVVVAARANGANGAVHATKRLRVNGIAHRATGVVGTILAVLFTSLDIDLITGPPVNRRRYLDITLSQVDPEYLRALQRYARILQQRNSLLRHIAEGHADLAQLTPWDDEMVTHGAQIIVGRAAAVAHVEEHARALHARLSDSRETLAVTYAPQAGEAIDPATITDIEAVREHLRAALHKRRRKEIAAGVSLIGPHRDDLRLMLDGESAATFGSRAQQRTVALAVRLAEAAYLEARSGEQPILLLDDILSELDERRRSAVLATVLDAEQSLITTADLDRYTGPFVRVASIYGVTGGAVELISAASSRQGEA